MQIGTAADDHGFSLAIDSSDMIFVCGSTGGSLDGQTYNGGGADAFIMKLNPNGALQWTVRRGSIGKSDRFMDIAADASGVVGVGWATGSLDGYTAQGGRDFVLQRFDSAGVWQWTRMRGSTTAHDEARAVQLDSDGNILVLGQTDGNMDGYANAGGTDSALVKYDSAGTWLATIQLGTSGDDISWCLGLDAGGNIHVGGHTTGSFPGFANAGADVQQ